MAQILSRKLDECDLWPPPSKIPTMKKICDLSFAIAFLIFSFSCVRYDEIDLFNRGVDIADRNETEVFLQISVSGDFLSKARALDFASENTIDNIYVLVFDASNNLVGIRQAENIASNPNSSYTPGTPYSATATFSAWLPISKGGSTSKLVVLGNSAAILRNTVGVNDSASPYIGQPYPTVVATIRASIAGAMYTSGGRIPMWGETSQVSIMPGGSNSHTVNMGRAVARIDVGVGQPSWNAATKSYSWNGNNSQGAAIPFRLTSVCVVRPNNQYTVIPALSNQGASGVATAPTIPVNTSAFSVNDSKSGFTFSATNGAVTGAIYVPEADIILGGTGRSGDAQHLNRMALVVGGSYNGGATTYYRLDFAPSGGNLINVLRNHLYQFNISGVGSPGFSTIDDAYNSTAENMNVNVLQWDQSTMGNIVFDGTNSLNASPDVITLAGNQYTGISSVRDNALTVSTNVSAGWTVEKIVNSSDNSTTASWVRLNPSSGTGTTTVAVSADQNLTGVPRTANVWIVASGLRYKVIVTQSTAPALNMRIVDNPTNNNDISGIIFASSAGVQPSAQSFTVNWVPAPNTVHVLATTPAGGVAFPNPGSNPAVNDGAPYNGQEITSAAGSVTYNVQPPAFTSSEIAANPFLQKSSQFYFSVDNGFAAVTKFISLTQINYALRLESPSGAYPLNPFAALGGNTYSYNVRSNANWRISSVREVYNFKVANGGSSVSTALIANSSTVVQGATGTANTSPGTEQSFVTSNVNRGNWGWVDVTYSSTDSPVRFSDVTQRLFFPSAQYRIYSVCLMPQGQADGRVYGLWSGSTNNPTVPYSDHDIMSMLQAPNNFGTNVVNNVGTSTVFTMPLIINGYFSNASNDTRITTAMIDNAVATGADMLVISGSTTIPVGTAASPSPEALAIFNNFLNKGKPVILCTEDPNSVFALWYTVGTGMIYASTTALNGTAPVYQINSSDVYVNSLFTANDGTALNGKYWGCDGIGSACYWFGDQSQVTIYSNAVNQSGSTDSPPSGLPAGYNMGNAATAFRMNNCALFVMSDGGFFGSADQTSNTQYPASIDGNSKRPVNKDNYGGGGTRRTVVNSIFMANIIARNIYRRTSQ